MDCSAVHRAMGVHLTFVRSCDLDEWTMSQIDAMRLGGNGNARTYFRKHGFSDLHGGKAEKKYKSKAAQSYKVELAKLVEAEAAKRGEVLSGGKIGDEDAASSSTNNSLLMNLDALDKKNQEEEAKQKLQAARNGSSTASGVLHAKSTLASAMPGASKLLVKPKTGGLGTLRKPTSGGMLKKKGGLSTAGASKMRLKTSAKLSMKLPVNGVNGGTVGGDDDGFEDIEETRKNAAEAELEAKKKEEDAALAKKMQEDLM